ncbi:hypothetical protein C2G38_2161039 [Gigaspora rosea]|uniref:Uncharacterized protein n=1 Tax=Gigaspora rosea TaxID=44941 RepID=A0A397VZK8_9GLOM|nr:hypothetical protein C2G38_2161039 [Gigaspora rosea]
MPVFPLEDTNGPNILNKIPNKYSTIENNNDITDQVIINIPKSDPGKQIIVASNIDKKERFIDEKINNSQIELSKKRKSKEIINNLKDKLLNLEEINYEFELNFNDSDFTQSKKKGKYRQDYCSRIY